MMEVAEHLLQVQSQGETSSKDQEKAFLLAPVTRGTSEYHQGCF